MQIQGFQSSFAQKQTFKERINFNNKLSSDEVSFSSLHSIGDKAMFVLEVNKTFSNASDMEIRQINRLIKETNAVLVYATGRSIGGFFNLKNKLLKEKGINIPLPHYLITNNGQFIFVKNELNDLDKDVEWIEYLQKTGFDSKKIRETMHEIAHRSEYCLSSEEKEKLGSLDDFELRKKEDPDFLDSKITYSDCFSGDYMLQYIVAPDVNIAKLEQDIAEELKKQRIKTEFIFRVYEENRIKSFNDSLLRKVKPLRQAPDGSMISLFLCPVDKGSAVKYLSKKLEIKDSEILLSGDETNDISMLNLINNGSYFICLNGASEIFKNFVLRAQNVSKKAIFSQKDGLSGIIDEINKIISGK